MTLGLTYMLVAFGLVCLVFVLFKAAAAEAGHKLDLGEDVKSEEHKPDGWQWVAYGEEGHGRYIDSDSAWPKYKISDY